MKKTYHLLIGIHSNHVLLLFAADLAVVELGEEEEQNLAEKLHEEFLKSKWNTE